MKRFMLVGLALAACGGNQPAEHYGFIARLGQDTISVESVVRRGNTLTSDDVDRFPRVQQRHTEITLGPDSAIQHLVMDITTPSEPADQRTRHIVADVTADSVLIVKRDNRSNLRWAFAKRGETAVAHVPQMYSLYELYFTAALKQLPPSKPVVDDTVHLRQFYIDREFDRFPLHHAVVRVLPAGKAEIWHDWLAGTGEATLDSAGRLLKYSGARTTYKVDVTRLSEPPNVQTIGAEFAALETKNGGVKQLSTRDTTRASIGAASFTVDYARPLARGRQLLGGIIPYEQVWRTGANAATQFTTSAPITLDGIQVPAGTYTIWTLPHANGADLIINKQSGQWGTEYNSTRDLARAPLHTETLTAPAEQFTIAIAATDSQHGTLAIEWGPFRWTAPIIVGGASPSRK